MVRRSRQAKQAGLQSESVRKTKRVLTSNTCRQTFSTFKDTDIYSNCTKEVSSSLNIERRIHALSELRTVSFPCIAFFFPLGYVKKSGAPGKTDCWVCHSEQGKKHHYIQKLFQHFESFSPVKDWKATFWKLFTGERLKCNILKAFHRWKAEKQWELVFPQRCNVRKELRMKIISPFDTQKVKQLKVSQPWCFSVFTLKIGTKKCRYVR